MIRRLEVEIAGNVGPLSQAMNNAAAQLQRFVGQAQQFGQRIADSFNRAGAVTTLFGQNVTRSLTDADRAAGRYFDTQNRLRESNGRFAGSANGVIGALSGVTLGYLSAEKAIRFFRGSVDTFANMDSLMRGLATLEKDADSLRNRLAVLNEVAKLPGLGLSEVIQFDVSLRSAGFSADLSRKSMMAFGNALAITGKGKAELKGLSVQLQQLAGKTGGFSQDLKLIRDYAPQVADAMLKAFGTSNTDEINKMGLTGKQVIERIIVELAKLPAATGGPKNAFENFGDVVTRTLSGIGSMLYNGLGMERFFSGLSDAMTKFQTKLANIPATTQSIIAVFGLLAVTIPPLIAGIGFFTTTILPSLKSGLIAVRGASLLLLGPWGLIAAGIAALAAAIIIHWDKIKGVLVSSGVWTQLKTIIKSALGVITSIFGVFANALKFEWADMWQHMKNLLKYVWNGITSTIAAAIFAIGGLVAKGLSAIGLTSWSKNIDKYLDEVQRKLSTKQFKINAPIFNPFAGFQFGGDGVKDGSNAKGGSKPDKAKASKYVPFGDESSLKTLESWLESQIQQMITNGVDTMQGQVDLDEKQRQLASVRSQLEQLKAVVSGVKPINIGEPATIKTSAGLLQNFLGSVEQIKAASPDLFAKTGINNFLTAAQRGGPTLETLRNKIAEIRNTIAALSFNKLQIPPELLASLKNLKGMEQGANDQAFIADATTDPNNELGPYAAKTEKRLALIRNMGRAAQVTAEQAAAMMKTGSDQLKQAGIDLMLAIGKGIGEGENPLKSALRTILSFVGDFLIQMGSAIIMGGTALTAATALAPFLAPILGLKGIQSTIAGGLLVTGGAAVKAIKMEKGGLLTGPVNLLGGESPTARAGGGEYVGSIEKGSTLMALAIMKKTPALQNPINFDPASIKRSLSGIFSGPFVPPSVNADARAMRNPASIDRIAIEVYGKLNGSDIDISGRRNDRSKNTFGRQS